MPVVVPGFVFILLDVNNTLSPYNQPQPPLSYESLANVYAIFAALKNKLYPIRKRGLILLLS